MIDARDEERNFQESEFDPDGLSYRHYNLLQNYDALKTVSKHLYT